MEYSEAELTLRDYFAILKRRYLFLIIPFVLVLTVSVGVALLMAPVYQSTGTIMVESQQIPDNFVQSTVTSYADERIGVITQRVMIRENLLRIIDKFNSLDSINHIKYYLLHWFPQSLAVHLVIFPTN